jgi:glycosyltransferase involved in cell wall biosynthesis
LHLTALVDSPDHVCCRYRLAAFRSHFAQAKHVLEFQVLPRWWWNRLSDLSGLAGTGVIVQRRLLSSLELWLLRRRFATLIFDFDDAVWLRDSYSAKGLRSARRLHRFETMVRAMDLVIAGNEFLAAQARLFTEAHRVIVIPTCVDVKGYPLADHAQSSNVQMVWIGSASTLAGMERFAHVLEVLGARVTGLSLKLISDRFFDLHNLSVHCLEWSERTERTELASADIGIAWMPDDDWSRGKCGLKVLQYMAAGMPVVANSVGVHRQMIRPGENGLLADSADDWCSAIRHLAANPALRQTMGGAGRDLVERRYSVAAGAAAWRAALEQVHDRLAA